MTGTPLTRRRFLTLSLAVFGAGAAGWLAKAASDAAPPTTLAAGLSTTTSATTSTPEPAPITTTKEPAPPTTTTWPPGAAVVVCRDAWRAAPPAAEFEPHTINQITVHHTAVVLEANTNAPDQVRQHQQYHQSRGWPDLAYHYVIDANGYVYEGRPVEYVGDTATDYDPTGHFLVCCEGDFNQQRIGEAQYRALVDLAAWGAVEFGVDPATIRGHRDLAATSCPGDNVYAAVADGTLAHDVAERIAGSAPQLLRVCGAEGDVLVAAIETGTA